MPITVTLPDGKPLQLSDGATGADAAAAIGPGLARAALAIEVSHPEAEGGGERPEVRDLARPLPDGASVAIVTKQSGEEALRLIRHDAAHVLAAAVMELYPGVKISIGPPIEQGFYYDFEFPDGTAVSEADFAKIEERMRAHVKAKETFERQDVAPAQARERFVAEGQDYKVELIDDLITGARARGQELQSVSLYTNGPFTDLCRGPHAPSTASIGALKLQSVAGAYWRGDSSRTMLTRIYGTAFHSKAELAEHLERLEQAKARDHRKLGRELDLFMFSELSPGSPFWKPAGMTIWNALTELWRTENLARGYREVKTPILYDVELWRQSGHWDKFRENMYFTDVEGRPMGLKPMNCPAHIQIYSDERRSYRDLPVRYSEAGLVHRHEPSGVLHGLLRVRHITQDDAHIFCTDEQVQDEVVQCSALRLRPLCSLRTGAAPGALHPARAAHRQRRDVGPRRGRARRRATGRGARLRAQPRRRLVLRPEDRPAHDRLDRALVAAGNGPAGLLDARTIRPAVHGRRQRRAPSGDGPPRAAGLLRALHRHPDRALRRENFRCGWPRCRRSCCRCPIASTATAHPSARSSRPRACASSSTIAASRWGARSVRPSFGRSRTCSSSASASQAIGPCRCASIAEVTRVT